MDMPVYLFDKTNDVSGTHVTIEHTSRGFEVTVIRPIDLETFEYPLDTIFYYEDIAVEYANNVVTH